MITPVVPAKRAQIARLVQQIVTEQSSKIPAYVIKGILTMEWQSVRVFSIFTDFLSL